MCTSQRTGADVETPSVKTHHGDTKAFALAAHQIFRRYANAFEIDLRSRLGMPAEFLFLRAEADARHILFDDEAAYALGAIVARADHHEIDFVLATPGDELRSEEHTS